jgi:hypothetical protein
MFKWTCISTYCRRKIIISTQLPAKYPLNSKVCKCFCIAVVIAPSAIAVAFPVLVTGPVKSAFVVTVSALPVTLPVILPVKTPAIAPAPVIVGAVKVLFVKISIVFLPTKVSVAAGKVNVVVPATAVAASLVVPEVYPSNTAYSSIVGRKSVLSVNV